MTRKDTVRMEVIANRYWMPLLTLTLVKAMLSKLIRYRSRNDIMVDLDKDTNEAEALMDIFDEIGEFDYDPITRHCFQVRNIPKE